MSVNSLSHVTARVGVTIAVRVFVYFIAFFNAFFFISLNGWSVVSLSFLGTNRQKRSFYILVHLIRVISFKFLYTRNTNENLYKKMLNFELK